MIGGGFNEAALPESAWYEATSVWGLELLVYEALSY
jgi:hypothetical protein